MRILIVGIVSAMSIGVEQGRAQCVPRADPLGRENLGACVNSPLDEAIPQVSPDGRTLYFTRRGSPANVGGTDDPDDIWVSRMQPDGSWGDAVNAGAPLNTAAPGWVLAVLADGGSLLIANAADATGRVRRGVSLARHGPEGWLAPRAVEVRDFSTRSDWGHVHLSVDGRAMLLSLVRADTRGGHDLYVSLREGDEVWGAPRSLGPELNTSGEEITPFLAADGVTLYFSTNGRVGEGGQDVFVSRRLDETWMRWSEPRGLGAPVNTPGDDAGYVLPASGEWAYFQSSVGGLGGSDLFRLRLPGADRPLPVVLLRGEVRDAAGRPVSARVRYGAVQGEGPPVEVQAEGGAFGAALRGGALWCVAAEADAGLAAESVDLRGSPSYEERAVALRLAAPDSAATCDPGVGPVHFAVGSAELGSAERAALDSLAALLRRLPEGALELAGHTDATGSDSANELLSDRRVRAVADYLAGAGVDPARVVTRAYGESRPARSNERASGRAANRRVEMRLRGI